MFEIVERQEMAQGTIVSNWIKAPKIAPEGQTRAVRHPQG